MKSIFISAPFFSQEQVDKIKRVEKALTKNPTVSKFYSARLHQNVQDTPGTNEWGLKIRNLDLKHLRKADMIVCILDMDAHDTDSGSAYETGYGHAIGKPVFTIRFDTYPTNLMISATSRAYFNDVQSLAEYNFDQMKPIAFKGKLQ